MYHRLFRLGVLALLAAVLVTASGTARAGDYYGRCSYKTVVCYEKVTTYETRQVPYTQCVTCYDECGRPYTVNKTYYREVRVPVTKTVPVTKRVPVYY